MTLQCGHIVRITSLEHGRLIAAAAAHGRAGDVPAHIRTTEDLGMARYAASGGHVIEDLLEYIAIGKSPATRGERSAADLFGDESPV